MDINAYRGLEPAQLWRHFAALNTIPRPSGHESQAREYVLDVARAAGASSQVDARGNAIVRVSPTGGDEGPVVAIQAHLDMVCEKDAGVVHDWTRDPIVPRREGDRIFARGTTLGADNGIGVAACLALIGARNIHHGGLELIFTVDEESGRWGALDLDVSLLTAHVLINLDSEDADALTVGSAGGSDVTIVMPLVHEPARDSFCAAELRLGGLRGGHSGMQIHESRANAVKLIADALERLRNAAAGLRLSSLHGGSVSTAIPRAAQANLAVPRGELPKAEAVVRDLRSELRQSWMATEPDLTLELKVGAGPGSVLAEDTTARLLTLLRGLPHGVLAESTRFANTVETSANLAAVQIKSDHAKILTSARSLSAIQLSTVQDRIQELALARGATATAEDHYPGWEPREQSPLVDAAVAAYRRTYGKEPRLAVLHGGLECGAIVARKPELEAISFGPLIRGAHTPEEHVYAPTVATTWELLVALLGDLAR